MAVTVLTLLSVTKALANDALIYYKNSGTYATTSQYNNLKTELEDAGFTVSSSTSGTVSSSDVSGQDLVIDITGGSNCGSTCKSVYDSYVSGGGKLVIVGVNGATNRNSSIEALIESKMSVGTMSLTGGCNTCYGSYGAGDYAASSSSGNILPGPDKLFIASGGTPMATNSTNGSAWNTWYKWDYGSNGGSVAVTFGYGQFLSTHTYASNMNDFLYRALEEEGLIATVTYTSSISNAQTTQITTSRAVTHSGNGIYINQAGDNNVLDIYQDGDDNLIAGGGTTTNSIVDATINGDNNDTKIYQKGDNNVTLFDIAGDNNDVDIDQGGYSLGGSNDNRIEFDIDGNSNTLTATQNHNDTAGTNGHYLGVDIDGNSNYVSSSQLNDNDKKAFISVQGNSNTIDVYQWGSGSHYTEIAVGSNQTVTVDQDGSGSHNASINMSGNASTLDLTQEGSTGQTYSLSQICNTTGGCGTTTVTQN